MAVDADEAAKRGTPRRRGRVTKKVPRQLVSIQYEGDLTAAIEALEQGIYDKVVRSAAYAAAFVFYTEMQYRVANISRTGQLFNSIYHYYDKKASTKKRHVYLIGPNKAKAAHWYNVEYGHWRYNRRGADGWLRSKSNPNARVKTPGTQDRSVHDLPGALAIPVWTPASPYIRPTYDGKVQYALQRGLERARERFDELTKELATA